MKSMVRIDDDLMQFVVGVANNNGISIQSYLNNILEKGIIKEMINERPDSLDKIESFCPQFGYDQAVREDMTKLSGK